MVVFGHDLVLHHRRHCADRPDRAARQDEAVPRLTARDGGLRPRATQRIRPVAPARCSVRVEELGVRIDLGNGYGHGQGPLRHSVTSSPTMPRCLDAFSSQRAALRTAAQQTPATGCAACDSVAPFGGSGIGAPLTQGSLRLPWATFRRPSGAQRARSTLAECRASVAALAGPGAPGPVAPRSVLKPLQITHHQSLITGPRSGPNTAAAPRSPSPGSCNRRRRSA